MNEGDPGAGDALDAGELTARLNDSADAAPRPLRKTDATGACACAPAGSSVAPVDALGAADAPGAADTPGAADVLGAWHFEVETAAWSAAIAWP